VQAVVTASRDFICVRPQTYEDQKEAELLLSLFSGRHGVLENTVFCVLAPDGERRLTRAGRSPMQQFDDADDLAGFLTETFARYEEDARPIDALPTHDGLALALNVASCDSLPLVVLRADDERGLARLRREVAPLAWAPEHIGRQHFVELIGDDAASVVDGLDIEDGLSVVEAGPYGVTGKVVAHARPGASAKALAKALTAGRGEHAPADKGRREHVRGARRDGITWDSELPVSDPGERGERGKRGKR
jgi:hypothetical protein